MGRPKDGEKREEGPVGYPPGSLPVSAAVALVGVGKLDRRVNCGMTKETGAPLC